MADDILTQLESREVCECEATLRSVAAYEIRRGRALITAVKTFLIQIDNGEACKKDEAPGGGPTGCLDVAAANAAMEYNDQIRQRVGEIQQLVENGGG